jgi:hypothetical protein
MSIAQIQIDEYDCVVLTEPLGGWPAGTRGVVQGVNGSSRLIEIADYDESRDFLDHILYASLEQIRLVWKCPPPGSGD